MKKPTLCTDIAGKQNGSGLCLAALCCMLQWIKNDSLGHDFLLFLQQLLQKDFQVLLSRLLELDSCRNPASNKTCHLTLPHIKKQAPSLYALRSACQICVKTRAFGNYCSGDLKIIVQRLGFSKDTQRSAENRLQTEAR